MDCDDSCEDMSDDSLEIGVQQPGYSSDVVPEKKLEGRSSVQTFYPVASKDVGVPPEKRLPRRPEMSDLDLLNIGLQRNPDGGYTVSPRNQLNNLPFVAKEFNSLNPSDWARIKQQRNSLRSKKSRSPKKMSRNGQLHSPTSNMTDSMKALMMLTTEERNRFLNCTKSEEISSGSRLLREGERRKGRKLLTDKEAPHSYHQYFQLERCAQHRPYLQDKNPSQGRMVGPGRDVFSEAETMEEEVIMGKCVATGTDDLQTSGRRAVRKLVPLMSPYTKATGQRTCKGPSLCRLPPLITSVNSMSDSITSQNSRAELVRKGKAYGHLANTKNIHALKQRSRKLDADAEMKARDERPAMDQPTMEAWPGYGPRQFGHTVRRLCDLPATLAALKQSRVC